jgi:Fe-S-cluster containining protein
LDLSPLYKELDRGDGTCKYLIGNICGIYKERPMICRVDECYDLYFSEKMTKEEYYKKNYEMCSELKGCKKS